MPDDLEHRLTLRQADQARTDFAALESDLEAIMARIARLPTRSDLAKTALGIILSTAALVILWAEVFGAPDGGDNRTRCRALSRDRRHAASGREVVSVCRCSEGNIASRGTL